MIGQRVGDAANDCVLVGSASKSRHVLADIHAFSGRMNRTELAAILRRGLRFQIKRVLVRRTAAQKYKDGRTIRIRCGLPSIQAQITAQRQTRPQCTNLQHLST
jgi:hypothetical protein